MFGAGVGPIVTFAAEGKPFASAEEAWIWAVQGMQSRLAGANVKPGMARESRPCEASDIFAAVNALRQTGQISGGELQVMLLYGGYAVAPSALGQAHQTAVPFWRRGMSTLAGVLEQKGIIPVDRKLPHHDR